MTKRLDHSIPLTPKIGHMSKELLSFCRQVAIAFKLPAAQFSDAIKRLRDRACRYQDQPTVTELQFMLICNLVLDFTSHGWNIDIKNSRAFLVPPSKVQEAPEAIKERIRQKHLLERDAQLREHPVQEFIKGMERRRLTSKDWHSIYSVMRDGEELAASLRRAANYTNCDDRARELKSAIDPYLQLVEANAVCQETGLRLGDIWRYFRHTWVNSYRSTPGRSMMFLIRDRARPCHPVMGIAALGSSVVQQSVRDRWIGWESDIALATLKANPNRKIIHILLEQLDMHIKAIYIKDLVRDSLLTRKTLRFPTKKIIEQLRKESERAIQLHRRYPDVHLHQSSTNHGNREWMAIAETSLFRSKRCKHLATLLSIRAIFEERQVATASIGALTQLLEENSINRAFRQLLRFSKAEHVGISMMDITVGGAIAPYNAILGGKLACLLLCSPEVVKHYASKYRNQVSIIASGMKGAKVIRAPRLALLCTTSLYGHGSSQYNRIKVPAQLLGGVAGEVLRYEELGTSEGFGSFHFSKESVRLADALLGRSKDGRKVNSIFGEGVNPLMRKMREALTAVGLPSDTLLRHGNKRIVYGVALARNFKRVLMGLDKKPGYIIPNSNPHEGTVRLVEYWIRRWLSKRIENPEVLNQVEQHTLAYPIRHGAQVSQAKAGRNYLLTQPLAAPPREMRVAERHGLGYVIPRHPALD